MTKLHLAAAALLLASSTAAFAQDYSPETSVIGGGAVDTASSVAGGVVNGVGGAVGGVGDAVGSVVAVPEQVLLGRSASVAAPYGVQCSVIGGGAAGTCSSVR